ncbi:MAG: aromatic acid decarboxylase [Methanobacteriota archaeon]|jgi:4-hydroxy-3-polyprenylbenzoate decarboxylase|nr:MAG: aromatic acid decarboxylase [Euryarchaeota archaeon]HIE64157.1 UbiX family flavin prenyltransferase [Candidatus Poseidoniales archaeon]HIK99673.1 UbiX family flavin prenyltransferase [Candidatus Poseidoniales archaeon]
MPEVVVAITGASGARYGVRLVETLIEAGWQIRLIVTGAGAINLDLECQLTPDDLGEIEGVTLEENDNLAARSASGSAKIDACVVCPASGTTIGKIAAGISDNLATRSALVALKERRKLILVPRETPYATPHLEAMAKMSAWGVVILPASPGFYHNPTTIEEIVDFVVARILDQMGVEHTVGKRWSGDEI